MCTAAQLEGGGCGHGREVTVQRAARACTYNYIAVAVAVAWSGVSAYIQQKEMFVVSESGG